VVRLREKDKNSASSDFAAIVISVTSAISRGCLCLLADRSDEPSGHKGAIRMAKYGKKASKKVEKAMHEKKKGKLKSGRSGKKVTSKKQAIAIGLSEARKAGGKIPRKKSSSKKKSSPRKKSSKKKSSSKKS
jgi:hypothetical protein